MTRHSRGAGPRRILYLHTTSEVGGSDVSLLRLVEAQLGDSVEGFEVIADETLGFVLGHIPGTRSPAISRVKALGVDPVGDDADGASIGDERVEELLQGIADGDDGCGGAQPSQDLGPAQPVAGVADVVGSSERD